MSNKIIDLLKVPFRDGDVGVEIEIEGRNLDYNYGRIVPQWRIDADGSLRGGYEFVLTNPISMKNLPIELNRLKEALDDPEIEIRKSYRAGVHIHINVQDLTPKQLFTFICSYLILEELLVNWCDKTRRGNHFCLRACDAEFLLKVLLDSVEQGKINNLSSDDLRYSSINLCSLFKYGSVEFRALESGDLDKVGIWAEVLYNIKEASLRYLDPEQLITSLSAEGYDYFLEKMLKSHADKFKKDDWQKMVRRGVVNAQPIAFGRKWSQINHNIFRVVKDEIF